MWIGAVAKRGTRGKLLTVMSEEIYELPSCRWMISWSTSPASRSAAALPRGRFSAWTKRNSYRELMCMIEFVCPHCNNILKISEQYLGQTGKCNRCGRTITIVVAPPLMKKDKRDATVYEYKPEEEDDPIVVEEVKRRARELLRERLGEKGETDLHFTFHQLVKDYYKQRDREPLALSLAIQACKQQIAIAAHTKRQMSRDYPKGLPVHTGYEQLVVIREKQRQYKLALDLCEQAIAQGWAGDWEKRIKRLGKSSGGNIDRLSRTIAEQAGPQAPVSPKHGMVKGWGTVVAGLKLKNDDGAARMEIARACKVNEELRFEREPTNPFDPNAIKVFRLSGEQLGYVAKEQAKEIAPFMDNGYRARGVIKFLTEEWPYVSISATVYESN